MNNNDYLVKEETLSAIADSIRSKTGSTEPMTIQQMPSIISSLTNGGGHYIYFYTTNNYDACGLGFFASKKLGARRNIPIFSIR